MTDIDFRKLYVAEVKASAESKKRCSDLIEWTEQQRQAAISSHAGQLRNTLAFKADVDVLVKALDWIVSNPNAHHANMVAVAKDALDAVGNAREPS